MSARALKAYSPLGKELDSLADVVTFGVAPAMMIFTILKDLVPLGFAEWLQTGLPYLAFVLAAFSALRLAKFNIDERQTSSFIGMPTPANALFWIGVCWAVAYDGLGVITNFWFILGLVFIFSHLLVSEISMFSF